MTEQNTNILTLVLDAAAPDKEHWQKGYDAFHLSTGTEMEAYYAALDAAAPDTEHWQKGYEVILTLQPPYHWSHNRLAPVAFIAMGMITTLVIWAVLANLTNLSGFLNFMLFVSVAMLCISGFVLVLQSIRRKHNYYMSENVSLVPIGS